MAEYIEREATCGDCIHACLCEHDASIPLFNRENKAYCGNFFPADVEPVRHARWEWFEEWLPSTTEHPRECEDCGWLCGNCKRTLEDMVGGYWDDYGEKPQLTYCPNCGARMDLEVSE